ncbi:hypothetical protein HPP92_017377 [Vanilla planifolia]|uniref:VHS domain-containing protein n=2 Tax=Vanilla planifolia TaxID=51239 RepID=A0A835Q966_VANPL|nr:hypothetical protein HPP92_017377 [Vanilla planifolia]
MPSSATSRVQKATSSQLLSPDMVMNRDICDAINSDPWLAKDFVKAVKKRLQNKNSKVQLFSLTLLETMIKNCNDFLYFQVVERGILQEMAKLVRKTRSMQLREKILVLLDSWQEKFGGPQGKYPQFYNTYTELKRSGVEFPKKEADSSIVIAPNQKTPLPQVGFGVPITTIERLREVMTSERDHFSSSGLDNIRSASELFSRMLQTLNPEGFKGKKGEVVSDLADRCLSHKKRLMQLINSTKNHGLLLEALTLNDQLEVVLAKYDALASSLALPAEDGEDEEEDGFSIIAKRNTTYNSTGGDEAKRPTEDKMTNWEAFVSVVLGVIMRKSICRFQEASLMAMELIAIFASTLRSSSMVYMQPAMFYADLG